MINKVILVGRVGIINEDSHRQYDSGKESTRFSLATSTKWYNKAESQYSEETTWHSIETWGSTAAFCSEYVKKGDLLYVEGSIKISEYELGGEPKKSYSVLALKVQKLSSPGNGNQTNKNKQQPF